MAMGSTGTVNITVKMMTDIKDAVDAYRTKADSLAAELQEEVTRLLSENFSGAAAEGFKSFYENNILPANKDGLTNLLKAIDDIAQSTLDAIPGGGGLDDQLGEGNAQSKEG